MVQQQHSTVMYVQSLSVTHDVVTCSACFRLTQSKENNETVPQNNNTNAFTMRQITAVRTVIDVIPACQKSVTHEDDVGRLLADSRAKAVVPAILKYHQLR